MQKLTGALTVFVASVALANCTDVGREPFVEERPSSEAPIVGGTTASAADWPWIVSLRNGSGSHFCGGTLIAEDWVLTAAHCPTPATVRVGPTTSTAVVRNISRIIRHPAYNASTDENDIALIQLSQAVTGVTPALLNRDGGFPSAIALNQATSTAQANTRIAGWGATSEGGSGSAVLLNASVPALTNDSCAAAYAPSTIFASNLCAGYQAGGTDTCQGDSGGPLTYSFGGSLLAGITSWGIGCARAGLPGVYTRVSSHTDWITQNVTAARTYSPTAVIVAVTTGF